MHSSEENELETMLSDSDNIQADSLLNGAFAG